MLMTDARVVLRFAVGAAVAIAFAVSPQFALAQFPGSLAEFASSPATGSGLNGTQDVVVSPDGNNVYAIGQSDGAIAEFSVGDGGALTSIGCIADLAADGSCDNTSGTGLQTPQAIAISPDGKNVYVAARDDAGNGDVAEFTRDANGSLTPVAGSDCIAENQEAEGQGCDAQSAHGLGTPMSLAVTDQSVYVADESDNAVTTLARNTADGSLSEPDGAADCIQDDNADSSECSRSASGISEVTGIVVSPDGANVYSAGPSGGLAGSIAEFSVGDGGGLTAIGCLGTTENTSVESCGGEAAGIVGITGLVVSPDGQNVYTASEQPVGPIAEFSRGAGGTLAQLPFPHNCIEEQGSNFGCGTPGIGIADGFRLVVSPDGADVYAAAPTNACPVADTCSDVAEFARDTSTDGSLAQLDSPDSCIQDSSVQGSECPNEKGTGLGGPGIAISPLGGTVYVTGTNDIAEFIRTPVTHKLSVTLTGSGNGAVSDGTGAISCPSACSNPYTANTQVTLTATPGLGSTFIGWSGACSGTGTCQVKMSDDMAVTATFTANATPPSPGVPTPVLTGAPTTITDAGAGFSGSVNPDGLTTTVFFQYGLDQRYSQAGASGPNYTQQTPGQQIGPDFATHGVGPVTVSGLLPNALYHVRIVATNSAGTVFGQDISFVTATSPAPGPPVLGKTFDIAPVSGLVFVLIHGQLVPVTELEQIPAGAIIDARHGTFELVINAGGGPAHDAAAKRRTQRGDFGGAVVRLNQATRGAGRGLTTVMMTESAFAGAPSQAICKAPAGDAHAASSKTIQLLHASAHGKFATSGRYSAATVRGTVWTIIARCDGTLVRDIKDEVVVTDFVRHKTIVLHAGQSYLAPGRSRK
jgi:Divergent InlB B-repeat domain